MTSKILSLAAWVPIAVVCSFTVPCVAQIADQRPLRIVVPYPPGGTADGVARLLSIALQDRLKRTVIVDNKPGASTIVGAEFVAHSAPDGNTLLLTTESTLATNPSLYQKLPYSQSDFVPLSLVVDMPMVLVANTKVKANNVAQVIENARRSPSESTYASIGAGSPQHLSMALFDRMAGTRMTHVPYRGGSPAMSDVAGGQVDYFYAAIGTAVPFLESGRMKAIGLTGTKRSPLLPGVPTIAESGLPGYESSVWLGLLAPAGMSKEKVAQLETEIAQIVRSPQLQGSWNKMGVVPIGNTSAEFREKIRIDAEKWGKLIRETGIKAD
ncbi:MAG: tripartite tricarboxylate transporter substrate binding protein [Pseudomonadota bacterium]